MSAIAAITVFDGAATPVVHTLSPISVTRSNGIIEALWRELITTVPTEAQISLQTKMETIKSGVVVTTATTQIPVMESISGQNAAGYTAAPKVAYVDKRVTQHFQHPRSTVAGRRLLRQLDINLQGNVSTSVAPVTTGALPEMYDLQVMPT
ncbi:TPA_asm: coat protein [ssRNA phage Esthiorhiza.1_8]|uniref:Coat protein n=2 Tax=Fiersviridae TaxID=2842319 RepID=A0A8S5L1N1_9VIRU|nr:coat protein [ssRNA phage Esthiorhiza.1_8]QDH91102.1 MAG: hypothetical protein H1RhizoLitter1384_000002 [Leviviridae sp.]DAD51553.1 TPA_asm: coat protein [ssRNA phage Esthiorhiza.1_8]